MRRRVCGALPAHPDWLLAPFTSSLIGRHKHDFTLSLLPIGPRGEASLRGWFSSPDVAEDEEGGDGRAGRLPDVRRRRRRWLAMDAGDAGGGPGALGLEGIEFLQHTGEGRGARGAQRVPPGRPAAFLLRAGWAPSPAACAHLRPVPSQPAPCCPAMAGTSSWPLSPSMSSSRSCPSAWRPSGAGGRERLTQRWVSRGDTGASCGGLLRSRRGVYGS